MTASNAIELLEEIKTEYRYNKYEEALKFAIQAIKENEDKKLLINNLFNTIEEMQRVINEFNGE